MNPSDKPTCVSCQHFGHSTTGPICQHEKAKAYDEVYGQEYQKGCWLMRSIGQPCGPEAKLWNK